MRALYLFLYIMAIIVLQTVIVPSFNFFGVLPDLVLVSAITFSVLQEKSSALFFSAGLGFLQDLLTANWYWNTIVKTFASGVIVNIKEDIFGSEFSFAVWMVIIITPLMILTEWLGLVFVFHRSYSLYFLVFKIIFTTLYNLLVLPVIFRVMKALVYER